MLKQQTIRERGSYTGMSLHRGVRTNLTFAPAPRDSGIIFKRVDIDGAPEVRAVAANVMDVRRATTLGSGKAVVMTVEHIMAALHACQIDNCIVEMDDVEPPIADGSALPFVEQIEQCGICEQSAEAPVWQCVKPLYFEKDQTQMVVFPAEDFRISCFISFGASLLDTQYESLTIDAQSFKTQLAGARTFCQYKELEYLINNGLALGGSLDNAMILHDGVIISKDGQRYATELCRHKMLDLVGDLYLTGGRVRGHFIAVKPGHPTNVTFAKMMLEATSVTKG